MHRFIYSAKSVVNYYINIMFFYVTEHCIKQHLHAIAKLDFDAKTVTTMPKHTFIARNLYRLLM